MGTKEEISKKIKKIREQKGLTQEEVAKKGGLSTNYFARVERGDPKVSMDILVKIAKGLGVKSEELLP